jgi:sarcosine oxidase
VPPTLFPNGKHLLKIGGTTLAAPIAQSTVEVGAWFRSGGSKSEAETLFDVIRALLPNRQITPSDFKPCVVTNTPSGLPHIMRVSNTAAVAVGGNGGAAKSSDEIGRLAAVAIAS